METPEELEAELRATLAALAEFERRVVGSPRGHVVRSDGTVEEVACVVGEVIMGSDYPPSDV